MENLKRVGDVVIISSKYVNCGKYPEAVNRYIKDKTGIIVAHHGDTVIVTYGNGSRIHFNDSDLILYDAGSSNSYYERFIPELAINNVTEFPAFNYQVGDVVKINTLDDLSISSMSQWIGRVGIVSHIGTTSVEVEFEKRHKLHFRGLSVSFEYSRPSSKIGIGDIVSIRQSFDDANVRHLPDVVAYIKSGNFGTVINLKDDETAEVTFGNGSRIIFNERDLVLQSDVAPGFRAYAAVYKASEFPMPKYEVGDEVMLHVLDVYSCSGMSKFLGQTGKVTKVSSATISVLFASGSSSYEFMSTSVTKMSTKTEIKPPYNPEEDPTYMLNGHYVQPIHSNIRNVVCDSYIGHPGRICNVTYFSGGVEVMVEFLTPRPCILTWPRECLKKITREEYDTLLREKMSELLPVLKPITSTTPTDLDTFEVKNRRRL
jgi:ribosomal protein L21E